VRAYTRLTCVVGIGDNPFARARALCPGQLVELDRVGQCPQLDLPLENAQLILEV
jgi:hypothetical protein